MLRHLEVHLAEQYGRQRRTLLIVDEAQDLPKTALEELRLLTNLERNNQPLLQVFLVGQKQLFDVLQLRVMEQLKQRIIAACEILPLPYPEVERYVFHRLQIAGWKQDPVLDHSIFPHLYHFSNGVPRKINQIMSRLLLHGFVENKHVLTAGDISEIIKPAPKPTKPPGLSEKIINYFLREIQISNLQIKDGEISITKGGKIPMSCAIRYLRSTTTAIIELAPIV